VQRRLTIALVAIALASVVLVGAGVLTLAQIGARDSTESEVRDRLDALTELVQGPPSLESLRSLERTRNAFGLDRLDYVLVTASGEVQQLRFSGAGPRRGPPVAQVVLTVLDEETMDRYLAGETVVVPTIGAGTAGNGRRGSPITGDGRQVAALRQVDLDRRLVGNGLSLGIVAGQGVATIGGQARTWFALSAVVVVVGAGVAAWMLARRLTRPITDIEHATASIASGDFTVRVTADGNDELADLGRSVNRMAADLERSKALDQQFLLSVSHDLRTPLTAIAGYAEALRDGAAEDVTRTGQIIATHASRLERLVGDLLDLAKLDANRFTLHLHRLDAAVVTGRTVAGLAPSAGQQGLALDFDHSGPAEVEADPDRLAQVVGNVIDNALKHAATMVSVSVTSGQGSVIITVDDDGPGIAETDLPQVFERLYVSAAQPERAENPTGMGLAIVRELTQAMGGSVAAGRAPEGGAQITVRLPLAATEPPNP